MSRMNLETKRNVTFSLFRSFLNNSTPWWKARCSISKKHKKNKKKKLSLKSKKKSINSSTTSSKSFKNTTSKLLKSHHSRRPPWVEDLIESCFPTCSKNLKNKSSKTKSITNKTWPRVKSLKTKLKHWNQWLGWWKKTQLKSYYKTVVILKRTLTFFQWIQNLSVATTMIRHLSHCKGSEALTKI